MRTSFTLKLASGLVEIPSLDVQVPDIGVQGLGSYRAGGNSPVGSTGFLVFTMTFEQYASKHCVNLSNVCVIDILYENAEHQVEVFPADRSSILVVVWSHAKVVIHLWLHFHQEFKCIIFRN